MEGGGGGGLGVGSEINVGMKGHTNTKDTRLLGGTGACFPESLKFENLKILEQEMH